MKTKKMTPIETLKYTESFLFHSMNDVDDMPDRYYKELCVTVRAILQTRMTFSELLQATSAKQNRQQKAKSKK